MELAQVRSLSCFIRSIHTGFLGIWWDVDVGTVTERSAVDAWSSLLTLRVRNKQLLRGLKPDDYLSTVQHSQYSSGSRVRDKCAYPTKTGVKNQYSLNAMESFRSSMPIIARSGELSDHYPCYFQRPATDAVHGT